MKKLIALMLVLVMAVSMAACGGKAAAKTGAPIWLFLVAGVAVVAIAASVVVVARKKKN